MAIITCGIDSRTFFDFLECACLRIKLACSASLARVRIVLWIIWIFNQLFLISFILLALDFSPDLELGVAHSTLRVIIVFFFVYLIIISALKRAFSRCWSDSLRREQEFWHGTTFDGSILNPLHSYSVGNLGCTYFVSGVGKCISMLENFIN